MAFFDDMTDAVKTYPETEVTIEIIDVVLDGNALNTEEEASFKIKVTNNGPLNLTDVTLKVKGLNGVKVRKPLDLNTPVVPAATARTVTPSTDTFFDEVTTDTLPTITGHGGSQTSKTLKLKAPAADTNGIAKNLVKATLEDWNANLDHILIGHSDPLDTVKGIYNAIVEPA